MRARGSSGTSQTSLGSSTRSSSNGSSARHPYLDPQEWARRRQAAVEHAARLREERALGGPLDDSYTFSPQVNKGQQHITLARQRTQQRASLTVARRHYQQQREQQEQLSIPRRRSIAGGGPPPPPPALGASLSAASSFALATVAPPVYKPSLSHPPPSSQQQQQQQQTTTVSTAMVPAAVARQHKKAWAGWGNEGPAAPLRRGLPPSVFVSQQEATVGLGAGQTSAFAKKRLSSSNPSAAAAGGGTEPPALTRKGSQSQGGKSRGSVQDGQRSGLASKPAWVAYWEGGGGEKDRAEKEEADKEEAEGEGEEGAASAAGVLVAPSSSLALLKAKLRGRAQQQQQQRRRRREPRAVLREEAGEDGWSDAKEEDQGQEEDGIVRAASGGGGGKGGHGRRRQRHRQQWSHGPYHDARLEGGEDEAPPSSSAPIPARPIRAPPAAANCNSSKWAGGPGSRAGGEGLLTECGGCGRRFNERALEVHTKICQQVFQSRRALFDSRSKRLMGTEAGKYHTTLTSPARALPGTCKGQRRPKGEAAGKVSDALVVKQGQQQRQQQQGQRQQPRAPSSARSFHHQHAEEEEEENGSRTFHSLSASSLGLYHHAPNGDKPFPATLEAQATPKWKHQSEAFRAMLQRSRAISRAEKEGRKITPAFLASLPDPSAAAGPHGDAEPLVPCPSCGRKFNALAAERHMPKCRDIVHKPKTLRRGEGLGLGKAARERAEGAGGGGGGRRRTTKGTTGGWKS